MADGRPTPKGGTLIVYCESGEQVILKGVPRASEWTPQHVTNFKRFLEREGCRAEEIDWFDR
jgi:hypothetical protein